MVKNEPRRQIGFSRGLRTNIGSVFHKVVRSVMSPIGVAGVALVVICLTVLVVFRYQGLTAAVNIGTITVIVIAVLVWCYSLARTD